MKRTKQERKRDNWVMGGGALSGAPAVLTRFERKVKALGLTESEYVKSEALRAWVTKNRNLRYVPEDLLVAYDLTVDVGPELDYNAATARYAHAAYVEHSQQGHS